MERFIHKNIYISVHFNYFFTLSCMLVKHKCLSDVDCIVTMDYMFSLFAVSYCINIFRFKPLLCLPQYKENYEFSLCISSIYICTYRRDGLEAESEQ